MLQEISLSEGIKKIQDALVGTEIQVLMKANDNSFEMRSGRGTKLKSFELVGGQIDVYGDNSKFEMHLQEKEIKEVYLIPEIPEVQFVHEKCLFIFKPDNR